MSKRKRIRLKHVGQNEITVRANKELFINLRYVIGKAGFDKFCRDEEMFKSLATFWHRMLDEDFRETK